jgi:hypothetical protein
MVNLTLEMPKMESVFCNTLIQVWTQTALVQEQTRLVLGQLDLTQNQIATGTGSGHADNQ